MNPATGLLSNKATISGFSSPAFVGIYSSVVSLIADAGAERGERGGSNTEGGSERERGEKTVRRTAQL